MVEPKAVTDAAVDEEPPDRPSHSGVLSETLGARLHRAGQRLAGVHHTEYGWEHALRQVLARMTRWQGHNQDRFARSEVDRAASEQSRRRGPTTAASPGRDRLESGRVLPADVRSWLRDVAGPGAGRMRVHTNARADTLARRHAADAVTFGEDTYFRTGRFSVDEPAGRGLLAHEAVHVAATQHVSRVAAPRGDSPPSAPARPAVPVGLPADPAAPDAAASSPLHHRDPAHIEEAGAQALERAIWTGRPIGVVASPTAAVDERPDAGRWPRPIGDATGLRQRRAPITSSASAPLAVSAPAAAAAAAGPPAPALAPVGRDQPEPAPALDLAALRRDLVTDLMRQLRTEAERGG